MRTRRQLLVSALAATALGVTPADEARAAPTYTPWLDKHTAAHLREVLALSDDEWATVAPRLEPVLRLLHERDRFTHPKPPKPPKDAQPRDPSTGGNLVSLKLSRTHQPDPATPLAALTDHYVQLITLATEPTPPAAEMKAALNDYRAARTRADAELARARAALRELMSLRQEGVLVVMGILD